MNWYAAEKLAEQHREDLLQEAEQERLVRQGRDGRGDSSPGAPVQLKLAFVILIAVLALTVAGPMISAML